MYGRRNPVLRHFGADELAAEGTLRAADERRVRGEVVRPMETIVRRPTPEFNEYFEFDRPVPSGLPPNARDVMVEEASSPMPSRRPGTSPTFSYGSNSPQANSPTPDPSSPGPSPPPESYESSPSVAYQAAGGDSGGSAGPSPQPYPLSAEVSDRQPYGGNAQDRRRRSGGGDTPGSGLSPVRSARSPGMSLQRAYDRSPPIQQPPFRSGMPVSGPIRRPGLTVLTGNRGRRSSSPDRSRSRSTSPQPSSDPVASDLRPSASSITSPGGDAGQRRRPSASDITSPRGGGGGGGGSGSTSTTPRRSLGAKIAGRSMAAASGGTPRGGAAARRPPAASPRGASSARTAGAGGGSTGAAAGRARATGADGAAAPAGRVPAWAPAAGIANMRLEDQDEATRVALMLNDPGVRRDGAGGRTRQDAAAAADPQQQAHPPAPTGQVPPQASPSHSPSPGPPLSGRSPSPGWEGSRTDRGRASDLSQQFYGRYRLRKHREAQGVPDYRFSQPRSYGVHAPVPQRYFSFDEAHPAVAEQHYARSPAQDKELENERRRMQQERSRAAQAESRRRFNTPRGLSASAAPSARQLVDDVDRLIRVREAGRARLQELEEEGETLRQATRQVQRRALDAIARSEQMSAASRSPSPGASPVGPALTQSRSRSPPHGGYYGVSGGAAYSRSTFGPPPPLPSARGDLYDRSPGLSPGSYRPASASPGSVYSPASARADVYGAGGYYGSPAAALPQLQRQREQLQQATSTGRQLRPLSAPPTSQGGVATHGSDEAGEILEILNGVERLPQHEQVPPEVGAGARGDDPEGAGADHERRARSIASSRQDLGTLGPDEQRIAMGMYNRSRYEEYQRQMDLEMQRRAVEGGYDSDLERDEAAELLVEDRDQLAVEEEARRLAEEAEREHRDAWMDEYRKRLGPEDGYLPQRRVQSTSSTGGSPGALEAHRTVLSDAEEGMLQEPFVPVVSPELTLSPAHGYASEGPDGDHPHRRTRRRLFFKSTVPEPFTFEERQKMRPKPISQVKLEQDLAIRRAEEEEARRRQFRSRPVPYAVVEPRYERMLLEAEAKRQLTHNQRLEELARLMEQPFSFYYRDKEQQEEREALARAAKDPNRFQVAFQARAVPQSNREERFRAMVLEMEARREVTRRRVEDARQAARERAAQEAAFRREAADRAYRERLRAVDPATHPHPPKPLGQLPDFNSLHRQNEVAMARTRANLRKRVTVPQEFTLNGTTPDEQAARARKAQERRQRIILEMQLDAELLPEARWPYKSPRGKVRRTPPPPYLVEWMANNPPGNRAAHARKSSTAAAATGGAYMTRAEREEVDRKASEKLRAEALKRADRLLKAARERRQREAAAAGGSGGGADFGLESDVGATAAGGIESSDATAAVTARGGAVRRRAAVSGRQDNPEVYVEARHAQVERRVREVVEETLLDQGIEAYRYVEGIAGAGGSGAGKGGDKRKQGKA